MYRHLLVPVGKDQQSIDGIGQAARFARALGARITFLHVLDDYAAEQDGAILHAVSPALFADRAAGLGETAIAKAGVVAQSFGVAWTGALRKSSRIHEAIVEAAAEYGCDLIFLNADRQLGWLSGLRPTLAQRVIAATALPVLLASAEEAELKPNMARAMAIIRDEHLSLAAATTAMKHHLDHARETGSPLDSRLLKAMIFYIREFPDRLHHPKEDAYLFVRIRERAPTAAPIIDQLVAQHEQSAHLLAELEAAVDRLVADEPRDAVASAFGPFAKLIWDHIGIEEGLILATARDALSEEDWREIAEAFAANGDPRFDESLNREFRELLEHILRRDATGPMHRTAPAAPSPGASSDA